MSEHFAVTQIDHKALQGRFDVDLGVVHYFSDGVYSKEMHIPKGHIAGKHVHNYSHLSILAKGEVIVRVGNVAAHYIAPACIHIEAGKHHSIESLEDTVWYCIHATEETDVNKVDAVLIQEI